MERLFARILSTSEANRKDANKVILYDDAKKQLLEFIYALRGCELMSHACSSPGGVEALVEDVPAKSVPSRSSSKRSKAEVHNLSKKEKKE
ncbi:DNA mismatch repair protein [Arachis hypogaea]|nr:DNA mismatch repair protein [Arachis hypogaea]